MIVVSTIILLNFIIKLLPIKKKTNFDPNILLKAELTAISYYGIHFSKTAKNEFDCRFAYHSAKLHNQVLANKMKTDFDPNTLLKAELTKKKTRVESSSGFL